MTRTISDAEASELDIQVWVDTSGSMGAAAATSAASRHTVAQDFAVGLANWAATVDDDGIGLGFFGGQTVEFVDGVTADKIPSLFGTHPPRGGTPMVAALTKAVEVAKASKKKTVIFFVTDGEPSDGGRDDLARVIVEMTKAVTDERINVQFCQVGDAPEATAVLEFLDDGLVEKRGAAYDAVDTKGEKTLIAPNYGELLYAALHD